MLVTVFCCISQMLLQHHPLGLERLASPETVLVSHDVMELFCFCFFQLPPGEHLHEISHNSHIQNKFADHCTLQITIVANMS